MELDERCIFTGQLFLRSWNVIKEKHYSYSNFKSKSDYKIENKTGLSVATENEIPGEMKLDFFETANDRLTAEQKKQTAFVYTALLGPGPESSFFRDKPMAMSPKSDFLIWRE